MNDLDPKDFELVRKFQKTDFENNNNKFWEIYGTRAPGGWNIIVKHGRVGKTPTIRPAKFFTEKELLAKVRGQVEKDGYEELVLHSTLAIPEKGFETAEKSTAVATVPQANPLVNYYTMLLVKAAGENIDSYLRGTVSDLSLFQISQGREILEEVVRITAKSKAINANLVGLVQKYYNKIPTKLPHKIDAEEVTRNFINDIDTQDSQLQQLEAAVKALKPDTKGFKAPFSGQMVPLSERDNVFDKLFTRFNQTDVHNRRRKIKHILEVFIPSERKAFEECEHGASEVWQLYHGTKPQYVRHIMNTGLKLPAHAGNYGAGIYGALDSSKSLGYTQSYEGKEFMFVFDGKVGKRYEVTTDTYNNSSLSLSKIAGYDCVHALGQMTHKDRPELRNNVLRYDEVVFYRPQQVTLKYLLVIDD